MADATLARLMRRDIQLEMTALLVFAGLSIAAPASAQVDLTGTWGARLHKEFVDRGHGPDVVDYMGLPLNEEGRARALSYSASELSETERQCLYYPPHYTEIGPFGISVWYEDDAVTGRVVAWRINGASDRAIRTIWMDGRPHPSKNALHTFGGFSTGAWEGSTLVVTTTHMKKGYIRRNGVPTSDQAVLRERFARHDNLLTITAFIEDPIYLTEPFVISRTWVLDPSIQQRKYSTPCNPKLEVMRFRQTGVVPHYLPGKNPFVEEVSKLYNLPVEAVLGGAETTYPEYRKKLGSYEAPAICKRYCCGWMASSTAKGDAPGITGCVERENE